MSNAGVHLLVHLPGLFLRLTRRRTLRRAAARRGCSRRRTPRLCDPTAAVSRPHQQVHSRLATVRHRRRPGGTRAPTSLRSRLCGRQAAISWEGSGCGLPGYGNSQLKRTCTPASSKFLRCGMNWASSRASHQVYCAIRTLTAVTCTDRSDWSRHLPLSTRPEQTPRSSASGRC